MNNSFNLSVIGNHFNASRNRALLSFEYKRYAKRPVDNEMNKQITESQLTNLNYRMLFPACVVNNFFHTLD
jgi:hypothetical protein